MHQKPALNCINILFPSAYYCFAFILRLLASSQNYLCSSLVSSPLAPCHIQDSHKISKELQAICKGSNCNLHRGKIASGLLFLLSASQISIGMQKTFSAQQSRGRSRSWWGTVGTWSWGWWESQQLILNKHSPGTCAGMVRPPVSPV